MLELQNVVNDIINRATPDQGQTESNAKMFGEILAYMDLEEINILQNLNYTFLYKECSGTEPDKIHQRVAYLQMVCYREIPDILPNHTISSIDVKAANAELWFRKFSARTDKSYKFYVH